MDVQQLYDAVVPLSEECFRDLDESVSQIKTFKKTQKSPTWCLKVSGGCTTDILKVLIIFFFFQKGHTFLKMWNC